MKLFDVGIIGWCLLGKSKKAGERVAVGGWLDSEVTGMQGRSVMADRYSADKVSKSLLLKMEVVLAMRRVEVTAGPFCCFCWTCLGVPSWLDAARGISACVSESVRGRRQFLCLATSVV